MSSSHSSKSAVVFMLSHPKRKEHITPNFRVLGDLILQEKSSSTARPVVNKATRNRGITSPIKKSSKQNKPCPSFSCLGITPLGISQMTMRRKGEAQKRLWDSKKKPQSQRMAFLLAASSLDVLGRLSFQKQKQHEHTGKCFEKNSQAASLPPKANAAIKKKSSSFHIEQRATEQRELTTSTWKWEWEQRERERDRRRRSTSA